MKIDNSSALFERAKAVLPSGYTRQMVVTKPHPLYVSHGEGCWITDVDGNRLIDWVNNFSAQIHGHAKAEIVEAITEQASSVQSTTMPSEWEVKLAELLVERIPSVDKVRFMNSGTEANIIAVKAARAYTGKSKIAKMEGGYHGQYDLLEASYQPMPDAWGNIGEPNSVAYHPGTPQSLLDEVVCLPLNNIDAARAILRSRASEIAAVILDPWRLQVGMVEPQQDFLEMLREETEKLGIILIFDEVWCLRFGYHGYQGATGITPDMTTMGKIIGGGQPIGALGGKDEFMSVFALGEDGVPLIKHSGTFTANPMSLAAGYTAMELMTRDAFDALDSTNDRLREGLEAIRVDCELPGVVQGSGSVSALIMTNIPITDYRTLAFAAASGLLEKLGVFEKALLQQGVMTLRGGFVGSTPMTNDDIDFTLNGYRKAIEAVDKTHPGLLRS
ncbi:aspartate aminotransferase family protein [Alterisphingorhabdus coralli]|uniref:Aspartate aminotransferase family protein n=1 Tax=Alterisphingorhabdus coralli TaxID=3071408 RepID=A0AA97I1K9_9SPHN|nr:aspartate aminotransferase family protein [Parasphingorhabdus sp. SCSIO 66989]WOE75498.1 aspartate aminotransferase family protein [Parasphingorhabdus sp. SCSIO 66989]